MRFFRRSLVALGVAATLPTVAFVAVGLFYLLRAERTQVETAALNRSRVIMSLIDANLRGDASALGVLATSVYLDSRDWREFYPRVQRVRSAHPHWASVLLYDVTGSQLVFDLRKPLGAPVDAPLRADLLQRFEHSSTLYMSDFMREDEPLTYLYLPVHEEDQLTYVFAIALRTDMLQEIVMAQAPDRSTTALVDRDGVFLARSVDAAARLGTPATQYVRDAAREKRQGLYPGVTYEGLKNYTAYFRSDLSGWSVHVAVPSSLIDTPTSWSFVVAGIAGLGSVLLGAILVTLVLRDMSERRRGEEALRQSQKMEAVGQLTGGIAHDFNNLLTAIIGNLDMIRTRVEGQERLPRLADNALEAARRGAKLASQLLAFSRNQRMTLAPVDLQTLLGGMNDLLTQSVGPTIAVNIDIGAAARVVSSDANQLELALLNLAVNARDAMPSGGSLDISTCAAEGTILQGLPRKPYVEIRVKDSGEGMSDAVRARALEPFFTTKPVGQGTGLGLSQVYGVVRESGGVVQLDSAPDTGTTVRLILPAATLSVPVTAQTAEDDEAITLSKRERGAHLLVVDDDKQVRGFVVESLNSLGYRVTSHAGGADALKSLQHSRFDLLVVDFAMPGMNGAEVAREATKIQQDLPVLLISGYADSAAINAALGPAHLLRKPFDLSELKTAVEHVFARATRAR